jgi:penicillin-binding protein 1A
LKLRPYILAFLAATAAAAAGAVAYVRAELPVIRSLADYTPRQSTRIISHDGQLIGQLYNERRTVVPFARMPQHVVQAFLAAEDAGFYTHEGIDWSGVMRALLKNLRPKAHLQGASTITQQTVKTLILGPERSYTRKLREALLARQMEQMLRKDEILALYLNQIYFGNGAWGVEEAAQTYFRKSVQDLDLGQAALLAAIPKNPARYNIKSDPTAAKARQTYVLTQMQNHGWATPEAASRAIAAPIPASPPPSALMGMSTYYVEHVRRLLTQRYGDTRVLEGGLTVTVGLLASQQAAAYVAVRQGVEDVARRHGWAGAPLHIAADKLEAMRVALGQAYNEQLAQRGMLAGAQAPRGYIWDLSNLTLSTLQDTATARRAVELVPLADYTRVRALVVSLDTVAHAATVDLGGANAILPLAQMAWARPFSPRYATAAPRDPSQALHVGDLVTVEIQPAPRRPQTRASAQPALQVALVPEPKEQGALVAIEPVSRWVRALVGGYAPEGGGGFNRATQALRQPGSAFKPILYAAGLQSRSITPASICPDSPVTIPDPWTGKPWRPENYEDGRYDGNITYRTALARSKNTCSVRLIQKVTPQLTIDMAHAMGIASRMPNNLTLALGTGDNTVLELCNAYATIASAGRYAPPQFIVSVATADAQMLEDHHAPEETEAMAPEVAYVLTSMMRSSIERGTARRALALERPLAGKTGTSQESRNVWFSGFAPQLVATVWMGFDNNASMGTDTGASAALPTWIRFMGAALAAQPARDFAMPEHVSIVDIDPVTGLASEGPDHVAEVFVEGTAPSTATQTLPSIYLEDPDDSAPQAPIRPQLQPEQQAE